MNDSVLAKLLDKIPNIEPATRQRVVQFAKTGEPQHALAALKHTTCDPNAPGELGVLQVYLLHQAGEYKQANLVMDQLIGLNISEQLVLENCPDEDSVMARWDPDAEGISVLCTTFNHARFIGMALAGLFSQITRHPFEVIVRDDASSDGTSDILSRWEERYPRLLKVHRLPQNSYQLGTSPMLAAMELASQPLMAMCEGDDFWVDRDKLEQQANALQRNPTWSAVTHNHFELDESNGRLIPGRTIKTRGFLSKQDLVNVNLVLWAHTLMIRRSLLDMPSYSLNDGVLGDQVLTAVLGVAGPIYFIGDLFGSVARRNLFSTYTPLTGADKQRKRIKTRQFLSPILLERGETQAAQRLQRWCKAAEQQLAA